LNEGKDMKKDTERPPAAVITGGTAGIGKAIALSLAKEGYAVIINGRRAREEVEGLINQIDETSGISGSCRYVRGNIGTAGAREEIAALVKNQYGALHVLVNNAAVTTAGRKDLLELTEDDMIRLLKVNLIAPFLLSAALAPALEASRKSGYMINISSISSYTASTNRADYCMSKAGLSMMTKLFAKRLADENIRVFEIRPGIIKTDMTAPVQDKYDDLIEKGLLPIQRWGKPEDVAKTVLGIVKGYHPYATGGVINVDGGFHIRTL
jgi:3-oxoacyl-[acyl-carrier protein] reductase